MGAGFQFSSEFSAKPDKKGESDIEGFKVTVRGGKLPDGQSYEIWTAKDLGLILLYKHISATGEIVQRFHNIRLEEPDPSVFHVPDGFSIATIYPHGFGELCARQEIGISGEPEPREVIRDFRVCGP